jgi:hypothetical protein
MRRPPFKPQEIPVTQGHSAAGRIG